MADLVRGFVHARKAVSIAEVCEWLGNFQNRDAADQNSGLIKALISLLCETGDFGFGTVRDECFLIALPERHVELPNGRVIALGDHGIPLSEDHSYLFPDSDSPATQSLLEYLQDIDDERPSCIGQVLPANGQWVESVDVPKKLARALALCGNFDPVSASWSIGELNAGFLNDWLGVDQETVTVEDISKTDHEQEQVISASAQARLLVEAGAGSGKTYVACARIASLVERGEIVPSRVLVLSFTRVAIAELRDRVASLAFGSGGISAIHTRTFDAFAARLLGVAGQTNNRGYDAGVRAATQFLVRRDPLVLDLVSAFEHVVIDEAQDLVGDRKAFCEALVDALDPNCGVTVLGDPAQAIYGYQSKDDLDKRALIEAMRDKAGFSVVRLKQDHRTKTSALREMFAECRENLLSSPSDQRASYFEVRENIIAAAVESGITGFAGHASTTRGLILTRSRRSLISAAEELRSQGRAFRLRAPDRPLHIEAWIGATLGGFLGQERISKELFVALFDELEPSSPRDALECWDILRELEGTTGQQVVVSNIAEALEDPLLEIVRDHEGTSGPLLSTIHAIKGRESDRVLMLLTKAPVGDEVDWNEEAKTLYVGATRASSELRTGWIKPAKYYRSGRPERYWAPRTGFRLLEIGLDGDLLGWAELVKSGLAVKPRDTIASIWSAANTQTTISAFRDAAGQYVLRQGDETALPIGCLSPAFLDTLRNISKIEAGAAGPDTVDGIMVAGATTVFTTGATGSLPPIGLMPLLAGFCSVKR